MFGRGIRYRGIFIGGTKGVQPISGCSWGGVYTLLISLPAWGNFAPAHTHTHTDPEMHTQTDRKTKTGSLKPKLASTKTLTH